MWRWRGRLLSVNRSGKASWLLIPKAWLTSSANGFLWEEECGESTEPESALLVSEGNTFGSKDRHLEAAVKDLYLQEQGACVESVTYISLLKQCGRSGNLSLGKRVHDHIALSSRQQFLSNSIIKMYSDCGSVEDARAVFNGISQPNVFTWTVMIGAYAQHGYVGEALHLFRCMHLGGAKPDNFSFSDIFTACSSAEFLAEGRAIHEWLMASHFQTDLIVETALIDMYGKCGSVHEARDVFEQMQQRNVVSWTAMIVAYAQRGYGNEALKLFRRMDLEGVKPDKFTFVSVLHACASIKALAEGQMTYARILDGGIPLSVIVGTALVNMFGSCGSLEDAIDIFEKMESKNAVSWTVMIVACARIVSPEDALGFLHKMDMEGVKLDSVSFVNVLESLTDLQQGRKIHERILASGFSSDVVLGNALLNMYGRCGSLGDARSVFDEMHRKNVATWTSMVAAYAQRNKANDALDVFRKMDLEGVKADDFAYISMLDVCTTLARLNEGKVVYASIVESGIGIDYSVEIALLNLYSKCGKLKDAKELFDRMQRRSLVTWNSIVAAYAHHGCAKEAIQLFEMMQEEGMTPDHITFINIVSACSHVGLVEEAFYYNLCMTEDYGIAPLAVNHRCMIDLLGRAGRIEEAEHFLNDIAIAPNSMAFRILLSACKVHGDLERGARIADRVLQLDPWNTAHYSLLSNMYAACGRWKDVERVRKMMEDMGVKKEAGHSWIGLDLDEHKLLVAEGDLLVA